MLHQAFGPRSEPCPGLPEGFSNEPCRERRTRPEERDDVVGGIPGALVYSAIAAKPVLQTQYAITVVLNAGHEIGILQNPFSSGADAARRDRLSGEMKVLGANH